MNNLTQGRMAGAVHLLKSNPSERGTGKPDLSACKANVFLLLARSNLAAGHFSIHERQESCVLGAPG